MTICANWPGIYTAYDDGDQRWSAFSTTVNDAILRFAPTSIKRVRKAAAHSYPQHIQRLTSKKALLWKKAQLFKTQELNKAYRESANAVRKAIYAHTCQIENNLIDSNNLGSFYQYVNKKLSSRCGTGCLKRDDGSLTNDPKEKAELLNKYFSSVFTMDDGCSPTFPSRVSQGEGLSSVTFTSSKVFKKTK